MRKAYEIRYLGVIKYNFDTTALLLYLENKI